MDRVFRQNMAHQPYKYIHRRGAPCTIVVIHVPTRYRQELASH